MKRSYLELRVVSKAILTLRAVLYLKRPLFWHLTAEVRIFGSPTLFFNRNRIFPRVLYTSWERMHRNFQISNTCILSSAAKNSKKSQIVVENCPVAFTLQSIKSTCYVFRALEHPLIFFPEQATHVFASLKHLLHMFQRSTKYPSLVLGFFQSSQRDRHAVLLFFTAVTLHAPLLGHPPKVKGG